MRSVKRSMKLSAAVLVGATILACDSTTEPRPDIEFGQFRAELTGLVNSSLFGSAASQADASSARSDRTVWVLDLDDGFNQIFLLLGIEGRPSPGTYPVVDPPVFSDDDVLAEGSAWVSTALQTAAGDTVFFTSMSGGSLVIESVQEDEIAGRLEYTGTEPTDLGPETISVTARFRANERALID